MGGERKQEKKERKKERDKETKTEKARWRKTCSN